MSYKIELKDALKGYTYDQDKIMSPEKTVTGFKEKTAKLNLDILSRTRRIDNGRLDIPVFFSECGSDAKSVVGTKKQMGKGGTPAQSEASAAYLIKVPGRKGLCCVGGAAGTGPGQCQCGLCV